MKVKDLKKILEKVDDDLTVRTSYDGGFEYPEVESAIVMTLQYGKEKPQKVFVIDGED